MKKLVLILSLVVICLFLFDGSVRADLVIMKNGMRYKCKVLRDNPDEDHILVRVTQSDGKTGTITIARRNIKKIDYDYDSRVARLAKDDYLGYYDLALFCIEHKMDKQALDALLKCVGKPNVPVDAYLHLARLYEKLGEKQKALDAYTLYYNANTSDEEVYKKIQELKRLLATPTPAPSASATASASATPPPSTPTTSAPPVEIKVLEGLEAQDTWQVAPWAGPGNVKSKLIGQNKVLDFIYEDPAATQKSAAFLVFNTAIERSKAKKLTLKAFNGISAPVQVALALWLGESLRNGEYYEAAPKLAAPGKWTTIEFSLDANWKCQPNWTYTEKLPDKSIWVAFLLVYPGQNGGTISYDEIAFDTGE